MIMDIFKKIMQVLLKMLTIVGFRGRGWLVRGGQVH